jgi:heme-degrading monooxygenase HmoA
VLVLHVTAVHEDAMSRFWAVNLPIIERLADAPGFIRRMSLTDGLSVYLIAFWRSVEDAKAFTKAAEHRAAVRALYTDRILFSHFVGLWRGESLHPRHIFCPACGRPTEAPVTRCRECGTELPDVFAAAGPRAGLAHGGRPPALGREGEPVEVLGRREPTEV